MYVHKRKSHTICTSHPVDEHNNNNNNNRLFMVPHLVRAPSAYKDIKIHSFYHTHTARHTQAAHARTHTRTHTHTHTHYTYMHYWWWFGKTTAWSWISHIIDLTLRLCFYVKLIEKNRHIVTMVIMYNRYCINISGEFLWSLLLPMYQILSVFLNIQFHFTIVQSAILQNALIKKQIKNSKRLQHC